jgi:hypothetical protein
MEDKSGGPYDPFPRKGGGRSLAWRRFTPPRHRSKPTHTPRGGIQKFSLMVFHPMKKEICFFSNELFFFYKEWSDIFFTFNVFATLLT